jgi:PadR family transcriptional regulator, regulatory protein PadR
MPSAAIELPQGTLDLLILCTLAPGTQHGWAIAEHWGTLEHNRRGKYYELTKICFKQLEVEKDA